MKTRSIGSLLCATTLLTSACTGPEIDDDRFDLSQGLGDESTDESGETDGGSQTSDTGETGDTGDEGGDGPELEPIPAEPLPEEPPPEEPGGEACQEFTDVLAPVPPSVLFVLDRSGSMMEAGFDNNDPDKPRWQALHESVSSVVLADEFTDSIEFAAKTFSSKGWGACGVAPGLDVYFAIGDAPGFLAGIPAADEVVNGGTPTLAAVERGLYELRNHDAEGSKVMVLVTDGAIGCVDDSAAALADISGYLQAAREVDGITTYVVGIAPGSNTTINQLQTMAQAGSGSDYFDASDADMLTAALADVVAASYENSCLLALEQAPTAPELTVVEVDGEQWPNVASCDAGDGWMWTNDTFTGMRLCNAACDALLQSKAVNVEFHCNPG